MYAAHFFVRAGSSTGQILHDDLYLIPMQKHIYYLQYVIENQYVESITGSTRPTVKSTKEFFVRSLTTKGIFTNAISLLGLVLPVYFIVLYICTCRRVLLQYKSDVQYNT